MKKFYGIVGTISTIIGFILTLSAQIVISTNDNYTWSRPYTHYEAETLTIKYIGIIFLISGIIDLALLIYSKMYNEKNVKETINQTYGDTNCSYCGLRISKNITICPKCKNNVRRVTENGTYNS